MILIFDLDLFNVDLHFCEIIPSSAQNQAVILYSINFMLRRLQKTLIYVDKSFFPFWRYNLLKSDLYLEFDLDHCQWSWTFHSSDLDQFTDLDLWIKFMVIFPCYGSFWNLKMFIGIRNVPFLLVITQLSEKQNKRHEEADKKDYRRDPELSKDEGLIVPHFCIRDGNWRIHHIILQLVQNSCVPEPHHSGRK